MEEYTLDLKQTYFVKIFFQPNANSEFEISRYLHLLETEKERFLHFLHEQQRKGSLSTKTEIKGLGTSIITCQLKDLKDIHILFIRNF